MHRWAGVADRRVGLRHHDDVRRVLHEGREAHLALLDQQVLGQGGTLERQGDLSGEGLERVGVLAWQFLDGRDDQEPAELVAHEQGRHEERPVRFRQLEHVRDVIAQRHLIRVASLEAFPLPCVELRQSHGRSDRPIVATRCRDDHQFAGNLLLFEDPDGDVVSGQREDGASRRRVDAVPVCRRDQIHPGFAQRLLVPDVLLLPLHQSPHPDHDEDEQQDRGGDQDREVGALALRALVRDEHGSHEGSTSEHEQAPAGELRFHVVNRFGQLSHRRVERGGAEEHVEGDPTGLEVAASGLIARVGIEVHPRVESVGDEQGDDRGDDESERPGLATRADGRSEGGAQEQQVREWVRHRGELQR